MRDHDELRLSRERRATAGEEAADEIRDSSSGGRANVRVRTEGRHDSVQRSGAHSGTQRLCDTEE